MSHVLSYYAVPVAIGAVAIVLLLGLINMMRGGSPNTSQRLMRWRVLLQFIAIVVIMATVWVMQRWLSGVVMMVVLNRIYTRTGDDGTTALGSGERRKKYDLRVTAYGTVDELNAAIGLARLHTASSPHVDALLASIQNDLFDLGADLCSPDKGKGPQGARLSVTEAQVTRLEQQIDALNADLAPLRSFVLPARGATGRRTLRQERRGGFPDCGEVFEQTIGFAVCGGSRRKRQRGTRCALGAWSESISQKRYAGTPSASFVLRCRTLTPPLRRP
jgi:ATP:cob(I)alamin adenosyltransferase